MAPLPASPEASGAVGLPTANPAVAYLAGLGARSRATQAKALHTVCRVIGGPDVDIANFPWHRMTFAHGAALRQELAGRYAPATANRLLSAWRGTMRATWRLGLIEHATFARAVEVRDVPASGQLRGRALSRDERERLFAHADSDSRPVGRRDSALLVLLYACGLRREEAAGILTQELTPDGVRVRGKGGRHRIVPVPPAFQGRLDAYAALITPGAFLRSVDKQTHELTRHPLTPGGVRSALRNRLHLAGVDSATPHDLRRSYITDLLAHGVDLLTVASLAGHARVDTTRLYDKRPHAARVAAVAVLGE